MSAIFNVGDKVIVSYKDVEENNVKEFCYIDATQPNWINCQSNSGIRYYITRDLNSNNKMEYVTLEKTNNNKSSKTLEIKQAMSLDEYNEWLFNVSYRADTIVDLCNSIKSFQQSDTLKENDKVTLNGFIRLLNDEMEIFSTLRRK